MKGKIEVEAIKYFKDDWGIVSATVLETTEGEFEKDYKGQITIKGNMPPVEVGRIYHLSANAVNDPKWGKQYEVVSLASELYVDDADENSKRKYLEVLFTERTVKNMYDALPDPFKALKEKDYAALVQVKGCQIPTAARWIEKFENEYSLSRLYTELSEYELSTNMLKLLLRSYKSPDIIISKIKENPYLLTEVRGIGFSRADAIAQKAGIGPYDTRRIKAYIIYYLSQQGQEGNSYVPCNTLMNELVEQFGEELPDMAVADSIHELGKQLWYDDEKINIGLMRYRRLEQNIADELWRIKNAKSVVKIPEDREQKIIEIEKRQGWEFTDQQRAAIDVLLDNNIVVINGCAGAGKSALAFGIIELLKSCSYGICALSGRAAVRLGEASGRTGSTIHRLLGFTADGFTHNKEDPLPQDIIVVDEISMIGGGLFYSLLQAVKNGAKLILLGDTGQLEAIGECNVANDIIKSGVIPVVTLDKIHRQGQKSAIITESMKVRSGKQLIASKEWAGQEIRGEKQDFILDCYSDSSNTYPRTLKYFDAAMQEADGDVNKVQILCPMKSRGDASVWSFNQAIQAKYNPSSKDKNEITVYYASRGKGILRVGDKVINVKNNYKTLNWSGKITPIFNGNIGTILDIDTKNRIITVDFIGMEQPVVITQDLSCIELGYAVTIHKYQGSAAEIVILALDFASRVLLSKELVYTGITRASKKCIVVSQNSALRFAVSQTNVSKKNTHLLKMLQIKAHPELEKIAF